MKQTIIVIIICIVLSLIPLSVSSGTLNILYGLVGVLFSVGMSLLITFNVSQVTNMDLRKSLRNEVRKVRNNFLRIFVLSTAFYVLFSMLGEEFSTVVWDDYKGFNIASTWSVSVFSMLVYAIIALVCNYVQVQTLYEDIEDRISEESRNGRF